MEGLKIGDSVVCVDKGGNRYLTLNKTYKIMYISPLENKIAIIDDSGHRQTYYAKRFGLSKINEVYGIVFFCQSLNKEKK